MAAVQAVTLAHALRPQLFERYGFSKVNFAGSNCREPAALSVTRQP
jgi:hypothetical protein